MTKQNGNAFFFILIAIALLGLLTMTMTRSGNNTNDTGKFEQNQIAANEILRYAKSIENAVQMLLSRGCSENVISFWHDSNGDGTEDGGDDYYNDDAPSNHSCHVFDSAGAGLKWVPAKEDHLNSVHSGETYYGDWLITGSVHVNGFGNEAPGTSACGTNCSELMISLNFLDIGVCNGINQITGHGRSDGTPVLDTGGSIGAAGHTRFTGGYLGANEMGSATPAADDYEGKGTGCIQADTSPASGSYTFYHVLHAR